MPISLLAWGALGLAASSVAAASVLVTINTDLTGDEPSPQLAVTATAPAPAATPWRPTFNGPGPYPSPDLSLRFTRDNSRLTTQLASTVFAFPIIDEFGTPGIEIFDATTSASFAWIPGRSPLIFQGASEIDASCNCEVYGRGFDRIQGFTGDPERLARLAAGKPYFDPGELPTAPASPISRAGRCSGPQCPTPSPPQSVTPTPGP